MYAFTSVAARRARVCLNYKRCTASSSPWSSPTAASLPQCAAPNTLTSSEHPADMLGQDSDGGHNVISMNIRLYTFKTILVPVQLY